jgi:hypothetical protein
MRLNPENARSLSAAHLLTDPRLSAPRVVGPLKLAVGLLPS